MRHFLILFDEIPIIESSVKAGTNSPEVVTAARCVNVGLFVSGDLRRDVIITLAKGVPEDLKLVSFPGSTLKRVSPDERSISFFLLKTLAVADGLSMDSVRIMDNGIEVRRTSLKNFIEEQNPNQVYVSTPKATTLDLDNSINSILIHAVGDNFESLEIDSNWPRIEVPYPPHPERLILDVNFLVDRSNY